MEVIIVPFDYKEESHFSVVPICIGDVDSDGNPIYREWVERGVVPVAEQLRKIAQRVLNDVWRVSDSQNVQYIHFPGNMARIWVSTQASAC